MIAVSERARLDAIGRYDIFDASLDGPLDRITATAARLLKVPIAIISIVNEACIRLKSRYGIDVEEVDRELGLCASCILQDGPWIVSDAKNDPRALANPLVAGEAGIRFYLGIPLRTQDGFNLGALSVLDVVPRTPTGDDVARLADLARIVMDELELRRSTRTAVSAYHAELVRRELREDHIRGLMRELAHRSKNVLAIVQAIARQTMPSGAREQRYALALSGRIQGLGYTHDLVTQQEWRGARLHELGARHIGHFIEPIQPRIELQGPDLVIGPSAAQHLGLAIHELCTNAVQHGSLSVPTGKVALHWQMEKAPSRHHWFSVTWVESHGPAVKTPKRKQFGCLVLERLVPEGLGGSATLQFRPNGVLWSCEVPSEMLLLGAAP